MSDRLTKLIFVCLAVTITGIYSAFLWPFLTDPATKTHHDFIIFATADLLIDQHGYSNVYDLDLQHEAQAVIAPDVAYNIGGRVLPFNHPPLLLPLFRLVITPDLFQSYQIWTLINAFLIAVCAWLSRKIIVLAGIAPRSTWYLIIPLVLIFPLQINLHQGQDIVFVLLGVLIFLLSLQTDNLFLGGLGLALTTVSPHLAVAFSVPWLFGQRKRLNAFYFWGGLFTVFSIWLVGIDGTLDYFDVLTGSATAEGGTFGVNKIRMYNFSALTLRFWRTMPSTILSALTWGGYIFSLAYLSWLHRKHQTANNQTLLSLMGHTVIISLFFAPHLHLHSLLPIWVSFLTCAIAIVQFEEKSVVNTGIGMLLASLIMTPIFVQTIPLRSVTGYVVIFATIYLSYRALQTGAAHKPAPKPVHTQA